MLPRQRLSHQGTSAPFSTWKSPSISPPATSTLASVSREGTLPMDRTIIVPANSQTVASASTVPQAAPTYECAGMSSRHAVSPTIAAIPYPQSMKRCLLRAVTAYRHIVEREKVTSARLRTLTALAAGANCTPPTSVTISCVNVSMITTTPARPMMSTSMAADR
jgi:hypothetical protein